MSTSSPRSSAERRRTKRAGAAYFEAILVIPSLILVFSLLIFVREGYTKAGTSAAETRTHGWVNVMDACREDSVPAPTSVEDSGGWSIARIGTVAIVAIRLLSIAGDQPMLIAATNSRTIGTFDIGENQYSQSETFGRPDSLGGEARYGHQIVLNCDEDTEEFEMVGMLGLTLWNFMVWNIAAWEAAGL